MFTTAVVIAWATALAIFDWRRRRIPNWLLALAWGIGAVHVFSQGTLPYGSTLLEGLGTAAGALLAFWPVYRAGWMAAGDVKLCATLGWLGGVKTFLATLLLGTVASGLIGLLILTPGLARLTAGADLDPRLKRRIPYGAGLAIGLIVWTALAMRGSPTPLG